MDGLIAYALSKKYADEVGRSILDAGFKTKVEQDRSILQTAGQEKILYFIPKVITKPSDGYDEYVYSNNAWERVGATDVDLSSIDYNDLINKPRINQYEIKDQIQFPSSLFKLEETVFDDQTSLEIDLNRNHVFCYTTNRGSFFSIYNKHSEYMQVSQEQYDHLPIQEDGVVIRFVDDKDPNTYSNYKSYLIYFPESEGSIYLKTIIIDPQHVPYYEGPWRKVGGSHIVSGVVNQNGTITFTDSDGNTFTTTGASVIGPQGAPGNDYVLTAQDKAYIADIVLQELPTTQGVLYGNTSN